jgi:S-adenosylmethionine hydrolase
MKAPDVDRGVFKQVRSGIVTLLTDFGIDDYFVGAMKGVILGRFAQAVLVDITHNIPPQDICAAAFTLFAAHRNFPPGTVHLAVVDPGVGSDRRPVIVETEDHLFVGPDNGLFSPVLSLYPNARVRHVTNSAYFLANVSATFHGRDIFAPVAAAVAQGAAPELMGPTIQNPVLLKSNVFDPKADFALAGSIIHIDRFGNCVTSFAWERVQEFSGGRSIRFRLKDFEITKQLQCYEHATLGPDQPFIIVGSSGFLEISIWTGSAARFLKVGVGEPVHLEVV